MPLTEQDRAEIRAEIEAQSKAGDEFSERLRVVAKVGSVAGVRELARLLIDEAGYFGDHMPQFRERVAPFACSEDTYHLCSFSTLHDPRCPAVGGDGKGFEHPARPCAVDCGETDPQEWCHVAGFNCGTCETVNDLLGLLAKEDA